ncbi:hypothetical protein E0I56_005710 [Escherichia coli]|nr:hypothetical protein [Escherichia coli]
MVPVSWVTPPTDQRVAKDYRRHRHTTTVRYSAKAGVGIGVTHLFSSPPPASKTLLSANIDNGRQLRALFYP